MQNLGCAWLAEKERQKHPCWLLFSAKSQLQHLDDSYYSTKPLLKSESWEIKKGSKPWLERKKKQKNDGRGEM